MKQSKQAKYLDHIFYPVSNRPYNRYERIVKMVELEEKDNNKKDERNKI